MIFSDEKLICSSQILVSTNIYNYICIFFSFNRGDHSTTECRFAVIPPHTECVIFSIDGSFSTSLSIVGWDPKIRPCSVDLVRYAEITYVYYCKNKWFPV